MSDLYHFLQQLVNGLTVGSTYALIAIGYTMVYGIIGMINFAHGEVYMIGSYVAFIAIAGLTLLGLDSLPLLIIAAFCRQHHSNQRLRLQYRTHRLPPVAWQQPA
jgi:branched-chain amino acid transport system permease protein